MKKTFLFLSLAFVCLTIHAQTNTFPATGNAGIGTLSPTANLDVVSTTTAAAVIRIANTTANAGAAGALQLGSQAGSSYIGRTSNTYSPSNLANALVFVEGLTDFVFQGASSEIIRFKQNGSVGIGTTNTLTYKLAVNGPAIFTKAVVKSYANWPDFVFKNNYQLSPLDSLEGYVKKNFHLPGLPSADSIAHNGIDLGNNQAAMLQKIEELTLYIIEQNKNQQSQNQRLEEMQRRMEKLELRVQQLSGKPPVTN